MNATLADYHHGIKLSGIRWTGCVWNVFNGCTALSPGCANCYAARLAATRLKHLPQFSGLAETTNAGARWIPGKITFDEKALLAPLKWRQPQFVFVNAFGDTFHESIPFESIDKLFSVMAACPQHTFAVLTKRPGRGMEYFENLGYRTEMVGIEAEYITGLDRTQWDESGGDDHCPTWPLPLPNVWLGVSVENQQTADERIPLLLQTPAAVRWISAEPLLGPLDIGMYLPRIESLGENLDWVVCGGESGKNHRPMNPDWARSLRDQCQAANIPFFFKQYSGQQPKLLGHLLDGVNHDEFPRTK